MACVLCDNNPPAGPCPRCEATKGDLRAENDRLRGRVAELEAALAPFACVGRAHLTGFDPGPMLRVADYVRAAELLAPAADDPGDLWRDVGGEGG